MKKRQGMPVNILFLPDGDGIVVSFNGEKMDMDTLKACQKALSEITQDITDKDLLEYNVSVDEHTQKMDEEAKNQKFEEKERVKESGYIYILSDGDLFKIGKTKNPRSRFKKYLTENPRQLSRVFCLKVSDYSMVENILHEKFAVKRHSREWFYLSDRDIGEARKVVSDHIL